MSLEVVRLRPDQWPLFRTIRLSTLATAPQWFGSRLSDAERFDEDEWRRRTGDGCFVALRDGEPVGVARLVVEDDEPPTVCSVFVEPSERGRGTARDLMAAVQTRAVELGIDELVLWVVDGNDAAIRLYEKCGFVASGLRQPAEPDDPDDERVELQMVWRAPSGRCA